MEQTLAQNFHDFEDAVQYGCGLVQNVNAIVTRDVSEFVSSEISVVLPEEIDTISGAE